LFKPATFSLALVLALVLGVAIGLTAGPNRALAAGQYKPAQLMGFYSPPMCQEDGGSTGGANEYCTLKDGYVIKFGDFNDDDCKEDGGRIKSTSWGRFCALHSGYAVKIDMNTSHQL
jgi:hypothetical protein